jgi:hypothetical protein
MPTRVQLSRAKGFRLAAGTVKVDRSTRWGNCFKVGSEGLKYTGNAFGDAGHYNGRRASWCDLDLPAFPITPEMAVALFRIALGTGLRVPTGPFAHPGDIAYTRELHRDIIAELRGHDLACWCRIGDPCHADVWLEVANAPIKDGLLRWAA